MKIKAINITILLLLGAMALGSPGWAGETPQSATEYVRVGYAVSIFGEVDLEDAKLAMDSWSSELGKMLNLKPKTMVFPDLAALMPLIKNREVEMVVLSSLDYLRLKGEGDLEPAIVSTVKGQAGDEFVVLAHRVHGVSQLSQLRGKTINIQGARGTDTIPRLWLDAFLGRQGLPASAAFFSKIKRVNKPSQAVLPVFFQQADAALVTREAFDTLVELNPQVGKDLSIIASSPRFLQSLMAVRKSLPDALKEKIVDSALKVSTYPRGSQILNLFRAGKLVPFSQNYLKSVEELTGKSR